MPENRTKPFTEKPAGKRHSLKINAISNWGPLVVNAVIGFVLTPYLINHLGNLDYGIYSLVLAFLGYYGLLKLGIGASIMRYVPFCLGSNDLTGASENTSTGMAIYTSIGLVISLLCFVTAEPLARFYGGGAQFAFLVRIMGLAAAFECPMRILDTCVRSHEKWLMANCVTIVVAIFRGLGLAGCVYFGYGLRGIGVVILAVTILAMVLTFVMYLCCCPKIHLGLSMVKLSRVRPLLSFGILSTVIALAWSMVLQGHKLLIGKLISLEAVTIYAVAALLMYNVRALVVAPNRVLWPRFANLDGKNRHQEIKSLFCRVTKYNAILASGIILLAMAVGPVFIRLWVGKEGFEPVFPALIILSIGYLIETSLAASNSLLAGLGHQKAQATIAVIEGILGLSLSMLLTWKIGLTGTALGFAIAVVLMRGLVCPWYVCRLLRIHISVFYAGCIMRPWIITFVLAIAIYSIGLSGYVHSWLGLVACAMIISCLYSVCIYRIAINDDERVGIRERVRKNFRRLFSFYYFSETEATVMQSKNDATESKV